jgi:hypothetical protein
MSNATFSEDQIIGFIQRLGRERLIDLAEERLTTLPDGAKSWKSLKNSQLAAALFDGLSQKESERLAAAGLRKQRQPSIGGPSWKYDANEPLTAATAEKALDALSKTLSSYDLRNVAVNLRTANFLDGVVDLFYTTRTPQATGYELTNVDADCPAMILLDYSDQVSTVSARNVPDQRLIGASWAAALGCKTLAPQELNFKPSLSDASLSEGAVQMLEAVYGRLATVGRVINVDHIGTRRQDPKAQVKEQTASGQAGHILLDSDVTGYLKRGDLIASLAFRLEYRYKGVKGRERLFVPHVTLASDDGTLILRVTRSGHDFDLASGVFQELRRALARATPPDKLEEVKTVLSQIK